MNKYVVTCATAMLLVAGAVTPAAAQDAGSVGLMMTSGSSVGLSFQVSESVAIRPSVAFLRATAENGGLSDGDRTSTGWAPGISVVFNVKTWDATRLYVSPQWTYNRTTASDDGANEAKTTGHSFAAMIGAQHNLGTRFAIFAEAGLARTTSEATFLSDVVGNKNTSFTTRSAIGAILFF